MKRRHQASGGLALRPLLGVTVKRQAALYMPANTNIFSTSTAQISKGQLAHVTCCSPNKPCMPLSMILNLSWHACNTLNASAADDVPFMIALGTVHHEQKVSEWMSWTCLRRLWCHLDSMRCRVLADHVRQLPLERRSHSRTPPSSGPGCPRKWPLSGLLADSSRGLICRRWAAK